MANQNYTLLSDAEIVTALRTRLAITSLNARYSAAQRIEELGAEAAALRAAGVTAQQHEQAALGALQKVRVALGLDRNGHDNLVAVIMELRGRADAGAKAQLDLAYQRHLNSRVNIELHDDGTASICAGNHAASEPCVWKRFFPAGAGPTSMDVNHATLYRWLRDTAVWPQAVHELRGQLFTAAVLDAMSDGAVEVRGPK